MSTQSKYPWRATARTAFAVIVGAAAMSPLVYQAATHHDPSVATGWAATGLGIAAGVTRVLALPQVNDFLHRYAPWLAADSKPADPAPAAPTPADPGAA
ncbi:MAG TPA: hypothetical protein VGH54_09455 [Mycobacterium sp.]|jgi:hypothetical protein|uniref:hypothetical protein n=1 Tax=Mycobacterium sp. TaxID=1785 RepID=UPI002F42A7C3